jgi:hypothetical protein
LGPITHGGRIEAKEIAMQPDHVSAQHQRAAEQQGRVVKIHREAKAGDAALAERIGITHDPIAAPDESRAEGDRHTAVEALDPSLALGRQRAQHEIRSNLGHRSGPAGW